MDEIAADLTDILEKYLGALTSFILMREIKKLGCDTITEMDDDTKRTFIENLLSEVYAKFQSQEKIPHTRSMLISKLRFSKKYLDSQNRKAFIDFSRMD
jgi:hypothetical protein